MPCLCPPRADGSPRHPAGDDITLRERLDFAGAVAARNVSAVVRLENPGADLADFLGALVEKYVLYGITAWTLVDERDRPIPVTKATIRDRVLADDRAATLVGDAADALYQEQILLPLVLAASTSSPDSPTGASTSAPTGSTPPSRTPSLPSSTTSTPTDATAMTTSPLAGVSS